MKSVNAAVSKAIRTEHDVKALPRLIAEWNQNRYNATTVTNAVGFNWEDIENDVDMFPIESITEPLRPSKGIEKARIGYGTVSDAYHTPSMPRYYISSLEDKYKYWVSPYPSDVNGNVTNCVPTVIYERLVKTNKIVIGLENSWATPTVWSIQVTNDNGSSWSTASSQPVIGGDGRAILYWNGSAWSSSKPTAPTTPTQINGIRLVVSRLGGGLDMNNNPVIARTRWGYTNPTGQGSYLSLIEMSARLEMDLSDDLISVSDSMDAGESNHVTPMGTITSNDGTLTLWNEKRRYSQETTGELRGLIDANVKMNLEYVYYLDNKEYPVQQFSLFTEEWNEGDDNTVQVPLSDASKFLKEIYPLDGKYENLTLAQIVYRLCDSVGYTDYNIMNFPTINDFRIPVFWTDGSQNLWEIFDELATATQSLIFFDSWGRLNVRPREAGYNPNRSVDWTLRAKPSGTDLSDIASLEMDGQYSTNTIKVIYKTTEWAGAENGHPKFQTVWSPEDTVTLRSAPLIGGGFGLGNGIFKINPAEATHWPYTGHVQVEGEFIEYEGKLFNFVSKKRNAWNPVWLKSEKEYEEMMEDSLPEHRAFSHFTGDFAIKERGVWNSEEVEHIPEAKGWQGKRYVHNFNGAMGDTNHHLWLQGSSIMRLQGGGNGMDTPNEYALLTRGSEYDTPWRHFGTRMRFNGNALHHRAGIVINQSGNGDGYYIQFQPTNTIENKDRDTSDEVNVFSIHNGNFTLVKGGQRDPDLVVADTWFDVDVYLDHFQHRISVWLNGKRVFNEYVPNHAQVPLNGKFGMFLRGRSNVDYEYIYAIARPAKELPDEAGFQDKVRGAYMGDAWLREWVYSTRERTRWVKRKGKKKKVKKNVKFKKNGQFFDEFGPYVHEVREFDVKFDPAPVAHSKLYFTNDWSVVCPVYRADAFGAYFILANAARSNAIAAGQDDLSFALAGGVNQQLLVYGLPLIFGDDEEVIVRNDAQVRARGEIIAEINSPWIQNEGAANAVANWIAEHWANGADQLRVKVFGNPLFEIGDVVAIDYTEKAMTPATHKYFVTGIDTQFENGITTNLTLQRKN